MFLPTDKGINSAFSKNTNKDGIKGHCDTHFFQVGSVVYLNDVEAEGGLLQFGQVVII